MALESLGAFSSTFVAGPSAKKSKGKEKSASGAKQNPFADTQVKKNPLAPANLKNYLKTGRIKLDKCNSSIEQDYSGCKDQYIYRPNLDAPQSCGEVSKDLNLTLEALSCDDPARPMLSVVRIDADILNKAVGAKSNKK